MFRSRSKMLLSSLFACLVMTTFPAGAFARGPGHRGGPPIHHSHHHYGPSWGSFLFGAVTGAVVHELLSPPRDAVVVEVRGARYYRSGRYYYRACWRGDHWVYVPVEPPPTVIIAEPVPAPPPVVVYGETYYRDRNIPYAGNTVAPQPSPASQVPRTAEAIPTPAPVPSQSAGPTRSTAGLVVRQLPAGAVAVRIGTTDYYAADGVYYLPVRVEGETRYVAVDDPTRTRR